MMAANFDIKKFDGTGDFGLWRIKMRVLLIQHGCKAALEVLPMDMEVEAKAELNKKAHNIIILCLVLGHTRDSRQSKGKSRSKSRGGRLKCYICQSEDHLKRNCPKNNHKKSTGYVNKDDQPSSSGSTYDNSKVMMMMSAQAQALLDLIMDSGCSYHMTPRLDILFDFLECDGGIVQLGDNRECKIRGIGKVKVQLKDGSSFVLHNVRVVLSGTRRTNCVYSLDGHAVAGELNASVDEKDSLAQVWHKRLGHISEAGLQVLEKQGLFGKESLGKLDFCENYVLGKSHRVRFGVGRHITQGVIDYVHSDLWGPSQVESLGAMHESGGLLDFAVIRDAATEWGSRTYSGGRSDRIGEDGDDEDARDHETDQTPDLTDYQLASG
ncbi:retrovirus-related pol polyprotein from transposon TNT 1-94 [Tanacetum coccineum]